ncbi:MAG: parallel beta-helix domain-containing protein [Myxococcota bacterium]
MPSFWVELEDDVRVQLFTVGIGLIAWTLGGCGDDDPPAQQLPVGCDALVEPSGGDDTESLQTELIQVSAGETLCLGAGTFSLTRELSLTVRNVTVRGLGMTRDDVVLDFAGQIDGDDGFTVTADGFTVENLSVKNTPGNGIVVTGVDGVTFRNVKVTWDAGSVTENGAYALYPVSSSNVLIEDCEVIGAADAGLYVGQSTDIVVRNNEVHGNVAGIEIENSTNAEVYGNHAYDNTAGVLIFVLPNLEKKDGVRTLVRDNLIENNNRANFAEEGTIVANVPPGTGVLLLASDETEIRDNMIMGNEGTGILIVSFVIFRILAPGGMADPETDQWSEWVYVHGNMFSNNGQNPTEALALFGLPTLEDVVWDGIENVNGPGAQICFGNAAGMTYRNINGAEGIMDTGTHLTDPMVFECDHTSLTFE